MIATVWDTFDALLRLQQALDASMRSGWPEAGARQERGAVFPDLNVFRQGEDFVVVAEIPGSRKRDLQVHLSADELRLSGHRDVDYGADAILHRTERRVGAFDRALRFPVAIEPDGAKAEYRDGILAILVPRAHAETPRTLDIQPDSSGGEAIMPRKSQKRSGTNEARSLQAESRGLSKAQDKRERTAPGAPAISTRFYVPHADIYETEEALTIVMDVPGVSKDRIEVKLENDTLEVEGRIDLENYRGLEPAYTEYNVGHFSRSFAVPDHVDANGISARIADGALTVNLPKVPEARRRRIPVH
ncbi:MAG: Hsp20 family protein [Gammaproteobacteria bacterium]|nr:Hsp20 family protein [Gammaproteobacteria bacterium]NIR81850.1 Hsp20 family protein [Gammaproteobacteria bacterium]NIR88682.1 Hsp20 family protein [Gammaproteobacteria bacterium]NIU02958.1 Hsp20 family protein [Gammaproteobacteria bacterium]NIV50479.1 Hsp20 family protein [Gammaproteobacteria bacterium]